MKLFDRQKKWEINLYAYYDHAGIVRHLEDMARQGWQLEKVWMGVLAVFVPAHVPVCYCIDWSDPGRDDGPGYRALLADAGWRLRQRGTCQNIYEAPAGTTPIQTDSVLEYRRFQDRALRRRGGGNRTQCIDLGESADRHPQQKAQQQQFLHLPNTRFRPHRKNLFSPLTDSRDGDGCGGGYSARHRPE